jgi:predicted ATPase/DNA-binding SARP family transcriptional activator
MDFGVLGPLRVRSDRGEVELGGPAPRTFLALLLCTPNLPVPDDRMVEQVWSGEPPPSAHHLLHVYASRLRRALVDGGGERIVRVGSGFALRAEPSEIDASTFLDAVSTAEALVDTDPVAADEQFSRAMHLWRGAPFSDLADPPMVVAEQAESLRRRHAEARLAWARARMALGRHRELVPELEVLASAEPYDEAVHAALMLALYRSRRQAEALATGRALQARLREDLGIEASTDVRDLYRRILLQDPGLEVDPPVPRDNLPLVVTSFVGRVTEVRDVGSLMAATRLLTLSGPAGIGKTRLALEVARQVQPRFPGGVWWVDLAHAADLDAAVEALADAIEVNAGPGSSLAGAVMQALRHRQALVLLDNCEHLHAALARLVHAILQSTAAPRFLATSRTPLGVEGEQVWEVPPLTLAAARQLFVERGRLARDGFALHAGNIAAVTEICRRMDCLSLGIEMAAAHLRTMTPREIAHHLDERFTLLGFTSADRLTRHQTLQAAIDASYLLLPTQEQGTFDRLCVFAGSFDLEAAAALAGPATPALGEALAQVNALVDASMLRAEPKDEITRFRLLETLREYGLMHLRQRGEEHVARQAHAGHFLGLLERAAEVVDTPDFAPWPDRLRTEEVEIQRALAWSLDHDELASTASGTPALREYWFRVGEARGALRWATRMLEVDSTAMPPGALAEVHNAAAFGSVLAMDLDAAMAHVDAATDLATTGNRPQALAFALWARSHARFAAGDLGGMQEAAVNSLAVCRQAGDRWGQARPLTSLGYAHLFSGQLPEARAAFEAGVRLFRELGDTGNLIVSGLTPLSETALRQHDLAAAEQYALEGVELGTGGWAASALVQYAIVLNTLGEGASADVVARRGLRVALDWGLHQWVGLALRELGRAAARDGRPEEAARLLGAARRRVIAPAADPSIFGPAEELCRAALGEQRLQGLLAEGAGWTTDQVVDLAVRG